MSQHYFNSIHDGEDTSIFMGWDKPLQGFFLVIEKPNDTDLPFWCNLYHAEEPHPKSLKPFLEVLCKFNIKIPQQMIENLLKDQLEDAENRVFHYDS